MKKLLLFIFLIFNGYENLYCVRLNLEDHVVNQIIQKLRISINDFDKNIFINISHINRGHGLTTGFKDERFNINMTEAIINTQLIPIVQRVLRVEDPISEHDLRRGNEGWLVQTIRPGGRNRICDLTVQIKFNQPIGTLSRGRGRTPLYGIRFIFYIYCITERGPKICLQTMYPVNNIIAPGERARPEDIAR